jgi:hypothetical protein
MLTGMVEIENESALSTLFGHWPDFHDAELLAMTLSTGNQSNPVIEATFNVAEMSSELDERGYFKDSQRALAVLRFRNVARVRLTDFAQQNVLDSLELSQAGPDDYDPMWGERPQGRRKLRVGWVSSVGCEANFLCDAIEVVSATATRRTS